ncbi:SPOR domain-containing protein [Thermomonas brevis]|uniref:SPOR domain-containing protein n=1 Tax=Thermomonas brevis TaxID=215691 RepID=A0A7G9QRJ8_9GAMM|nr:SPOR domain-containing protein [Thermomonas brevis]QNN45973.1 SPOR domain-containing protein [Thermomonas brevis]
MDASLKQRLVGAAVLVALAVIFLPLLVKGPAPDSGVSDVSLRVPPEPKPAADGMVTQDLPLVAPAAAPAGGVSGMPAAEPADAAAEPAPAPDAATPLAAVAAGDYAVSFGNYANAADADKVIAALQSAGLPGYREAVTLAGKQAQRVRIGPFADRAMAESARLRATQVRTDVDTKVVVLDAATPAEAPAPATKPEAPPPSKPVEQKPVAKPEQKPATKPEPPKPAAIVAKPEPPATKPANPAGTGFAVQIGAFADAAAATALRDKLRAAGFNAFTDSVDTDGGRRTRVRVGPVMTRAEADALKAQVKAKAGVDGMVRPHP